MRIIYLKDFKLSLSFKGKLKWHGEQGRLEIIYNEARRSWYAYIPVEVQNDVKAEGKLKASIDLGIVNLATVYVEDGSWYIFKGGSVLSQYEYYSKRISIVQKTLARHKQRRSRKMKSSILFISASKTSAIALGGLKVGSISAKALKS